MSVHVLNSTVCEKYWRNGHLWKLRRTLRVASVRAHDSVCDEKVAVQPGQQRVASEAIMEKLERFSTGFRLRHRVPRNRL